MIAPIPPLTRHRSAVTALLLLAAFLRFFRLDQQSMWFDEAARLLIARLDWRAILSNTGRDTLPPFFHFTTHLWLQLDSSDFWLRLPPAFAGILLVAVVYRLASDWFDRKTAVIAAFLTAISPYQIFHAQQANLYSLFNLLAALQILFFWRAIQRSGRYAWLAYTLVTAAGLYTHYFAAWVTIVLHLFVLLSGNRYRPRWLSLALADAGVALLFLPQLATFLREAGVVSAGFWLTPPTIFAPLTTLILYIANYSLSSNVFTFALFAIIAFLFIGLFELTYQLRRNPSQRHVTALVLLLAFLPIAAVWLLSQYIPLFLDRTLIIVTPAFFILLARFIAQAPWKSPTRYLALAVVAIMLLSLFNYYTNPLYFKPDYRAAATFINGRQQSGDAILHTSNGSYLPFLLYQPPAAHFLLAGDPAPHHPPNLHEVVGGRTIQPAELAAYQRLWLVVALEHSIEWQAEQADYFAAQYQELEQYEVSGIQLILYDLQATP
jgi:mannosyltransferase